MSCPRCSFNKSLMNSLRDGVSQDFLEMTGTTHELFDIYTNCVTVIKGTEEV